MIETILELFNEFSTSQCRFYKNELDEEESFINSILKRIINSSKNEFDSGSVLQLNLIENKINCEYSIGKNICSDITSQIIKCNLKCTECEKEIGVFCSIVKDKKRNSIIIVRNEEPYKLIIDGKESSITPDFIDVNSNYEYEYLIPIYLNSSFSKQTEKDERLIYAIIVLWSNKLYTTVESDIFSNSLSKLVALNLNKQADKSFNNFIDSLSGFHVTNYQDEYLNIFTALMKYAHLKDLFQLKYASIWTFVRRNNKESNLLFKEVGFYSQNANINKLNDSIQNKIQNVNHPYLNYLENNYKSNDSEDRNFSDNILVERIKEINGQLHEQENFKKLVKLNDDDFVIIFPIEQHPNIPTTEEEKTNIQIIVLYIDYRSYSYFLNYNYLKLLSHKIYENIIEVSYATRKKLRQLLSSTAEKCKQDINKYYNEVIKNVLNIVEFEYACIYLREEKDTKFILKSFLQSDITPPLEISIDNNDSEYVHKFLTNKNSTFDINNGHPSLFEPDNDSGIYSMMKIPVHFENERKGYLVCFNNKRKYIIDKNNSIRFNTCFSNSERTVMMIVAEEINLFMELQSQIKSTKMAYSKLSHEIPSQSRVIYFNLLDIQEEINTLNIPNNKKSHILNILEEEKMAATRVNIFSKIGDLKQITEEKINRERKGINLKTFFRTLNKMYNKSCEEYGVNIRFNNEDSSTYENTVYASPLFELVMFNLITNAIHYAYYGTTIIISGKKRGNNYIIQVKNMGIEIPDKIISRIFEEEGYRTVDAQNKNISGTGFGLKFSKTIIDAHGSSSFLNVTKNSEYYHKNIFGMYAINSYIKDMVLLERSDFLNIDLYPQRNLSYFTEKLNLTDYEEKMVKRSIHSIQTDEDKKITDSFFLNEMEFGINFDLFYNKHISKRIFLNEFKIILETKTMNK